MGAKGGEGNYDALWGEIEEMPFNLFLHAIANLVSPEEINLMFAFLYASNRAELQITNFFCLDGPLEPNLLIENSKQKWRRRRFFF